MEVEGFRFADHLTPGGHRCDEVASALQKTIRRGNEREALHWATELVGTGRVDVVVRELLLDRQLVQACDLVVALVDGGEVGVELGLG